MSHKIKFFLVILFLLQFFLTSCIHTTKDYTLDEIDSPVPQHALEYALQQLGKPYELGGQGPEVFDCSGIIIRAYEDALQSPLLLMNKRHEIRKDVNMHELYTYNVRLLDNNELFPGDIVFITHDKDRITHGGLFIGWKDNETIEFLNASSYYGKVLIDEWPIQGTKRGQWFVGCGRLIVGSKK